MPLPRAYRCRTEVKQSLGAEARREPGDTECHISLSRIIAPEAHAYIRPSLQRLVGRAMAEGEACGQRGAPPASEMHRWPYRESSEPSAPAHLPEPYP